MKTKQATVHKSIDPHWNKFGVIHPDLPTQWFDSEDEAIEEAKRINSLPEAKAVSQ